MATVLAVTRELQAFGYDRHEAARVALRYWRSVPVTHERERGEPAHRLAELIQHLDFEAGRGIGSLTV